MKKLLEKIGDMFLDQEGGVDEKRVLGVPILVAAVVYVIVTRDLTVYATLSGLGLALLGVSVAGDQGKLGGP